MPRSLRVPACVRARACVRVRACVCVCACARACVRVSGRAGKTGIATTMLTPDDTHIYYGDAATRPSLSLLPSLSLSLSRRC